MKKRFRRLFTGMLSAVMTLSAMPLATIHGENEVQRYPYTFFAGSSAEGAITINANNVCINGNIATNGTITSTSANFNVNGTITENAAEPMVQCFAKIDNTYFDPTVVETYFEDYFLEDTNINVNTPIEAEGDIELIGNINISSGLKALNDVNLSGNVENTQNSAICSETGDIIIDTENVNLSGLVYAPNGNVNISAMNLNINGVVIIADTITIDCPSLNANYSSAVGEFIGTSTESEPETEIYLITYGEYIHETESIKVYWNTNVPQGTFDIQVSDDGESYTSVGTVTDEESYEYAITEPFLQKYIKVIETIGSGDSFESSPIIVKNSNNGYDIEPLDSDEDGLPDFFELKIGTALDNADTDNDGLTDYQEFVIVGTDPVIFDSAEEGTSDADYDSDSDGLSNIDEVTRTTDPGDPDTDMDGLSDYDEIFVYNTDPLVADSDNDGIDDGSEIKLGLDPNSAATHGVPDGEYKMDQAIDTDNGILSSINTEESPYSLSIEMNTNGDIEKEISVVNSGYSNVIENNAMIGASLDISMSDTCDPEDIVLKYDIKPEFTVNTLDKYSALPEFQGIKRLNVFKFNEEEGMLLPIETKFSDNGTQLYAEVDELGTYCVMDMEIWLDNLGVDMPENDVDISSLQVSYPSSTQIMADEKKSSPVDLVFIIQTEGFIRDYYGYSLKDSTNYLFSKQKEVINQLSEYAFSKYSNVNVYIMTYDSKGAKYLNSSDDVKYYTDYSSVKSSLDSLTYSFYPFLASTIPFNRSDTNRLIREDFGAIKNRNVFMYHFINNYTIVDELKNVVDDDNKLDDVDVLRIPNKIYSYITPSENYFYGKDIWGYEYSTESIMKSETEKQKGLFLVYNDNCYSAFTEHLDKNYHEFVNEEEDDKTYNIILPTNWQTITLNAPLVKDGKTNSDEDSLTDWEEIDQTKVTVEKNGKVIPPEFNIADLLSYTGRYKEIEYSDLLEKSILHIPFLPIISDPTSENFDNDALNDDLDPDPLFHDPDPLSYTNILSAEIKYIPLQKVKSFTGKIGHKLAKKWDCDVYISILKSCDCDDDIFLLTNEDRSLSEVFAISDEIKNKLNNGEKEYSNSFLHVPNEEAAHIGKLETDQLVPEFFEKDSSYYYGCWYHNYCQEMNMYNYYVEQISTNWKRVMQAVIVYNIASAALQNAVLSSDKITYNMSKEEYANTAKDYLVNLEKQKGVLKGSTNGLTKDEIRMVEDLLNEGKNVEIIPRSDVSKRPDFFVNDVKTELKTLNGSSLNTPVTRIQDGFKQGAETVLIDARKTSITKAEADIIIERTLGVYKGQLPGNVEIWTQSGVYRW